MLQGCKGTVAFEGATANGRPLFAFSFMINDWKTSNKSALGTLDINATSRPVGPVLLGSTLQYATGSHPVAEFSFNANITAEATPSIAGTQGRSNFVVTKRAAAGTIKPLWSSTQLGHFVSGSAQELLLSVGSTGSNAYAISVTSASFNAMPSIENLNSQLFMNMPFAVVQANSGSHRDFKITLF